MTKHTELLTKAHMKYAHKHGRMNQSLLLNIPERNGLVEQLWPLSSSCVVHIVPKNVEFSYLSVSGCNKA